MKKILQIIPAIGWEALYEQDDGSVDYSKLVCFALVEEDGVREVTGMCIDKNGETAISIDISNFLRYENEKGTWRTKKPHRNLWLRINDEEIKQKVYEILRNEKFKCDPIDIGEIVVFYNQEKKEKTSQHYKIDSDNSELIEILNELIGEDNVKIID